jgi:hypothetical protein
MSEGLKFDLRRSARRKSYPWYTQQLTVTVSADVLIASQECWPELTNEINKLSGVGQNSGYGVLDILQRDDDGLAFAVRDTSIGAASPESKKNIWKESMH